MNTSKLVVGEGAGRRVLAVPSEQVHVAWLALPSRTPVQARAAARALLAERLAAAPVILHVAVSDEADAAGRRVVVAVDPAVMAGWLEDARAQGFEPDAVVPDCLLLPSPASGEDDTVQVLPRDGRWLVRGNGLALAADPALAGVLLGDRPRTMIDASDGDAVIAHGASYPPVDLLQDTFARGRPSTGRRLRWLAAAVVLLPLLLPAVSAARHGWTANALRETGREEASIALGTTVDDPLAATDARLASLRAANLLPHAVSALAAAVASRPGMHVDTLRFRQGESPVVRIVHGGAADLAALDAALRESGLTLALLEEGAAADGRRRSDLRVEAAP